MCQNGLVDFSGRHARNCLHKKYAEVCKVYSLPHYWEAQPNFMKFGIRGQAIDKHVCQIFSQSVQGSWSSDTDKIAIFQRLAAS